MGYQGADRLGGTMLGGSQVFGWRAGRRAAEIAKDRPGLAPDQAKLDQLIHEPIARQREAKGTKRPSDLLPHLQRAMWKSLLVAKTAASLLEAKRYVAEERDRLERHILIADPMDHALAFEHRNLLDVAEVIIEAATRRTESRGSHYRSDHPQRDDGNWLSSLLASRRDGKLELRKEWINEGVGWTDEPGDVRIKPWG
jgi:succinate dehydrogenase/fumarate reductase flavoprotein subunit